MSDDRAKTVISGWQGVVLVLGLAGCLTTCVVGSLWALVSR
jgi:hypothetical protein